MVWELGYEAQDVALLVPRSVAVGFGDEPVGIVAAADQYVQTCIAQRRVGEPTRQAQHRWMNFQDAESGGRRKLAVRCESGCRCGELTIPYIAPSAEEAAE